MAGLVNITRPHITTFDEMASSYIWRLFQKWLMHRLSNHSSTLIDIQHVEDQNYGEYGARARVDSNIDGMESAQLKRGKRACCYDGKEV